MLPVGGCWVWCVPFKRVRPRSLAGHLMPLRPVFKLRGWVLSSRWSGLVQTHSWALPSGGSPGCPRCPHQQSGLRRLLPKSHKWLLTLFTHCPPLTRVRCECSRKSDRRATGPRGTHTGHHCPRFPSTEPPNPRCRTGGRAPAQCCMGPGPARAPGPNLRGAQPTKDR